jgi:hypothetical protein
VKVYLAGERQGAKYDALHTGEREIPLWLTHVKRRLFSYFYHNETNGASQDIKGSDQMGLDLFLDSGAFTAFTKGVEIKVEDYAQFIHNAGHMFTVRSSLDAIGNPEKSYEYLKSLESLGVKVQPVFHAREDDKWLIKYLDEGYDYIFIGGMVPETTGWLTGWLDGLFTKYLCNPDGTARVKLHGFGLTDQKLMFRYPWYSVDSTSWLMTGIFGACVFTTPQGLRKVVFSDESPEAKKFTGWHYKTQPPMVQAVVDKWLAEFGVTAEQCASHYSFRDAVNAATFQRMENMATERFAHFVQKGLFD